MADHTTKVHPEPSRTGEINYRWHCTCGARGKAKGSAAVAKRAGAAHCAAKNGAPSHA